MSGIEVWIPALLIGILTALVRRVERTWMAPGTFFATYWTVMVSAPLIMAPRFPVFAIGVWWVFLSVLVFCLGSVAGRRFGRSVSLQTPRWSPGCQRTLVVMTLFLALLGLISVALHARALGAGVGNFASVDSINATSQAAAIARYHESFRAPTVARVLLAAMYAACPLGGMLFFLASERRFARVVGLGVLVGPLALMAVLTTKSSLLMSLGFWIGGYISVRVWAGILGRKFLSLKTISFASISTLVLSFLFTMSMASRYGWFGQAGYLERLVLRMQMYGFGHLSAFSRWAERTSLAPRQFTAGTLTFGGPLELLGVGEREQGIIVDFVFLSGTQATNVYTVFRGLVSDFSAMGSLVVLILAGVFSGFCFESVRRGHFVWAGVLPAVYGAVWWSFVTSILNYNSIVLMMLLTTAGTLLLTLRMRSARTRESEVCVRLAASRNHRSEAVESAQRSLS